ncbi:MAG: hypothetical protein ACD_60C00166G0013 [uncultured bacterium]|nr:MAG: hypothetical protein ACD_60C00166G0013 [uncultured bacterium]
MSISEIQFEEISGRDGNLGLITLTRLDALNALNQAMLQALKKQLTIWEAANHIKAVVIRACEGRAFCAGGDIRSVYQRKMANDPLLQQFFRDEYCLNRHIHHYLKPYIALIDGITMGGGVGISLHGSYKVATDRILFAMPETAIGFYPDVGTTYLLSRLPHNIGYYLGLSGARITLNDCVALHLIDHGVKRDIFPELIYKLADTKFQNNPNETVKDVISGFSVPSAESALLQHQKEITECFSKKTMEDILQALEKHKSTWCHEVAAILRTKSPTSLKVTLLALQQAEALEFDDCMQTEYRLTSRFIQEHDFFEGIRAVLIDKDQTPCWKPDTLKKATATQIKKYFAPLEDELIC